jgi:hypothetical protein
MGDCSKEASMAQVQLEKASRQPVPPAERMRLHRTRRRNGLRFLRVLLAEEEIDVLVAKGFLPPDRRHLPKAIQDALEGFICTELGPPDNER